MLLFKCYVFFFFLLGDVVKGDALYFQSRVCDLLQFALIINHEIGCCCCMSALQHALGLRHASQDAMSIVSVRYLIPVCSRSVYSPLLVLPQFHHSTQRLNFTALSFSSHQPSRSLLLRRMNCYCFSAAFQN